HRSRQTWQSCVVLFRGDNMELEMDNGDRITINNALRHERLPDDLRRRIGTLYPTVGRFISPTPEHWEEGFRRDEHPEREVGVWEDIEEAFLNYMADHPAVDRQATVKAF